ncbi:hypothetical protein GCM10027162_47650 [Streptomyces incanus]
MRRRARRSAPRGAGPRLTAGRDARRGRTGGPADGRTGGRDRGGRDAAVSCAEPARPVSGSPQACREADGPLTDRPEPDGPRSGCLDPYFAGPSIVKIK